MYSGARVGHRHLLIFLFGLATGCAQSVDRTQHGDAEAVVRPPDSSATRITQAASSTRISEDLSVVRSSDIPPAVRLACDSAQGIAREALEISTRREEGNYFDTPRGTPRVGCRLTAKASFKSVPHQAGPVAAIDTAFVRHHWRHDLRYSADGPDGSTVGMRLRDILCSVAGRWNGGDDEDTTSTTADDRYEAIIECARDVPSNIDAGVPDSIWRIAAKAGLDSIYAISLSLQFPPYLEGDFDGDGVRDAAVLIEHRATGKLGAAIVHRGAQRVTILGAGQRLVGPDDLGWVDSWDVFGRDATIHLTIHDRPNNRLVADALWVGKRDSTSAFYTWTGKGFAYEEHKGR